MADIRKVTVETRDSTYVIENVIELQVDDNRLIRLRTTDDDIHYLSAYTFEKVSVEKQ